MSKIKLSKEFIKSTVKLALNEDLYPSGDITSGLINNHKVLTVKLISNQTAIVGGLLFAKQTFALIDDNIKFTIKKKDGSRVKKGNLIALIKATKEPFFTFELSFFLIMNFILLSINAKVCFANNNPPTIAL